MSEEKIGKIYMLKDPRFDDTVRSVRYIGSTIGTLEKRLLAHFSETHNHEKRQWIKELRAQGLKPIIELIESTEANIVYIREEFWTDHYLSRGCRLFNYYAGTRPLINVTRKISESNKRSVKWRYPKQALSRLISPHITDGYGEYLRLGRGVSSVSFDEWQGLSDDKKAFHALTDELFLETLQKVMSNPALWGDMLGRADE